MLVTKSRLEGNSVVIPLPSVNGKSPEANQEYVVIYAEDGVITLIPKIKDPFVSGKVGEFYEEDEWGKLLPAGRELLP